MTGPRRRAGACVPGRAVVTGVPSTLLDPIDHWARHRPRHPAIVTGSDRLDYGQLAAAVERTAGALRARDVEPGERVAIMADNHPAVLVTALALWRLGAVFVPLNTRLTTAEHEFQIRHCGAALAVGLAGRLDHLRRAAAGVPVVELAAVAGPDADAGDTTPIPRSCPDDPSRSVTGWRPAAGAADALLVYTSGTTGRPKGAVHSHQGLAATIANGVAAHDLSAADVGIAFLPLFHVGGLNIQVLPLLAVGATVVLHERFDPGLVLDDIARHRATVSLFVPATMRAMLDHPDFGPAPLASLRGIMAGSSIVPDDLLRGFIDAGVPTGQVYGSTETGPTSIVLRFDDAHRVGSCGRPALHARARLDADGQILVAGPHLFIGYWDDPEATRAAFDDGWYRTGDVGRCDAEGWFHVIDRLGDVIISGGENVYPAEVEAVLAAAPGVAEIAVVGGPDERWGEVPVAVAVAEPGATLDLEVLRRFGGRRLARFKLPHRLHVVDDLPRTALGKVQKFELTRRLERASEHWPSGPVGPVPPPGRRR
ncbi:MAG: class I adenylate-forming enzyme family protein [Acidimicrobiales bacterium]